MTFIIIEIRNLTTYIILFLYYEYFVILELEQSLHKTFITTFFLYGLYLYSCFSAFLFYFTFVIINKKQYN